MTHWRNRLAIILDMPFDPLCYMMNPDEYIEENVPEEVVQLCSNPTREEVRSLVEDYGDSNSDSGPGQEAEPLTGEITPESPLLITQHWMLGYGPASSAWNTVPLDWAAEAKISTHDQFDLIRPEHVKKRVRKIEESPRQKRSGLKTSTYLATEGSREDLM
jgi:hypothetical protein